jgi:hypothetical protein
MAIPALDEYDRQRRNLPVTEAAPEPPDDLAESNLWQFFLYERDEILRLKWIESQKAGQDIGIERAILDWLRLTSQS